MNKTKKLTQGAMMLAILGALILIDRMTAYWFTEIVVLIAPIIIIMYSCMQTFKDGLLLSVGVIIISFLLGNFQMTYLIYVPVGVITGLVYSYGIIKGFDKTTLVFIAIITYAAGEVVASYVIYPLFGFPVAQMIEELKLAMNEVSSISGINYSDLFSLAGANFDKIIVFIYLVSVILLGAMEGVLIHILSIFLLKRFKIKDLGRLNLWEIKPNKVLSYISFISMFGIFFVNKISNDYLHYALMLIMIIGFIILVYYGYLFLCLYGAIVLRKNIAAFFILISLFIPVLFLSLIVMGFLYGTGPLRIYLENKINFVNHE